MRLPVVMVAAALAAAAPAVALLDAMGDASLVVLGTRGLDGFSELLVGSTSLAEREDPEVVQSVVGRAFDRLSEEVQRYEGLLEKFMGDAVLAVFGVPRAH